MVVKPKRDMLVVLVLLEGVFAFVEEEEVMVLEVEQVVMLEPAEDAVAANKSIGST